MGSYAYMMQVFFKYIWTHFKPVCMIMQFPTPTVVIANSKQMKAFLDGFLF